MPTQRKTTTLSSAKPAKKDLTGEKVASLEKEVSSLKSELAKAKKAITDLSRECKVKQAGDQSQELAALRQEVQALKDRPVSDPRFGKLAAALRSLLQPNKRKEFGL